MQDKHKFLRFLKAGSSPFWDRSLLRSSSKYAEFEHEEQLCFRPAHCLRLNDSSIELEYGTFLKQRYQILPVHRYSLPAVSSPCIAAQANPSIRFAYF